MEKMRNASQSVMERVSKTLAVADVRKVVMKATETQNTPPSAATCGYAAPNSLSKNLEIRAFDPTPGRLYHESSLPMMGKLLL